MKKPQLPFVVISVCGIALVLFCLFGSQLTPMEPTQVNMQDRLQKSTGDHWLGTDHLGRDLFSRIVAGAQTTIGTSFLVLALSLLIGVPVGLISAYIGGKIDRFLMRIVDAFLAFPDYIAAIVLSGLLGPGLFNLIAAMVIVKWVGYARVVRSIVLQEKSKEYVLVAKLNGVGTLPLILRHFLPHVGGHLLVLATLDIGKIILMMASLSYIGLGTQPPTPEWGTMLNEGRAYFYNAPQLMLIPGVAIILFVLAFTALGEYIRGKYQVNQ
ncbi:ABC transporter permease [Priestia megaterium]|uniref:nickel transporter permease n=1 Tax=Priestia megaterium TaxID=1404 RepID=UPI001C2146FA|nr:nickel transporter permease [Priestia megaterium]MBU8690541.1 ABC transporter permease [Priestia megaterium]